MPVQINGLKIAMGDKRMSRTLLSALLAAVFALSAPASVFAQTAEPAKSAAKKAAKSETKSDAKSDEKAKPAKKPLTAQQQKMKDCGAKWQEEKKSKGVKGRAAYNAFNKECLKS